MVDSDNSATRNLSQVYSNGALMEELIKSDLSQDFKPTSVKEQLVTFGRILEDVEVKESSPNKCETYPNDIKCRSVKNDLRSFLINEHIVQQYYCGNAIGEGDKLVTTEMSTGMIPEKFMQQPSDDLGEFYTSCPQGNSSIHNQSTNENMRQNFDQVVDEYEDLTTIAESSPEKAKESSQIEETISSKCDLYKDNICSFSANSINIKPNFVNGALDDVRLHDGASTSDLETYNVGIENEVANLRIIVGTEEPGNDDTTSARYSFCHLTTGESSLPGLLCTYGPTNLSDHTPYSGSISLRSDSSTTSGHSFAFPILQSEWNSSPVKMAKADRHSWRKLGWVGAIICCKF